eukprot:1330758-Amorphochlora_amoeboformis.AAC.2
MEQIRVCGALPSLVSSYKDRLEFNTKVEEHPIIPRADRAPDVLFTAVICVGSGTILSCHFMDDFNINLTLKSTTMEHVKQEEYRNHPTL